MIPDDTSIRSETHQRLHLRAETNASPVQVVSPEVDQRLGMFRDCKLLVSSTRGVSPPVAPMACERPGGCATLQHMEIKWTDVDPETGQRRFVCAERFAREWRFKWKLQRRGEWTEGLTPTREIWEKILDALKRRYRRREGVTDEDVEQVERIIKDLPQPRELE
jgi:hypothetical protein